MKPAKQIFIALLLMFVSTANAQMVLEYKIINTDTKIALPLAGNVNVSVNWGDGSFVEFFNFPGDKPHTFTTTGTKTVTITGTLTAYGSFFNSAGNTRLTRVLSWDLLGLKSFNYAFCGATNLFQVPASLPAGVTNMSHMFEDAVAFNQSLNSWNTAAVTDMSYMFYGARSFNQPIGAWNTAAVTNMRQMFSGASSFNQPIGSWNTVAVKDMNNMFSGAIAFNQPIAAWNTANVTDMGAMFFRATAFNQPIDTWNTASVNNINSMFSSASAFNQPIGSWNTAAVQYMGNMFNNAVAFNQPIGKWNVSSVTNMNNMFTGAALCTDNYDNLLNGWAAQTVKNNLTFDGGTSKYSPASQAARAKLIGKGWTITDAGAGTTADAKCTTTNIEEESVKESEIVLYPNPAKDKLNIRFSASANEMLTYSIYNITGLILLEKEIQSNGSGTEIGLEALPQGAYIIKIKSKENVLVRSFEKE